MQAVAPDGELLKLPESHAKHALIGPPVALYVTLNGLILLFEKSMVRRKDA